MDIYSNTTSKYQYQHFQQNRFGLDKNDSSKIPKDNDTLSQKLFKLTEVYRDTISKKKKNTSTETGFWLSFLNFVNITTPSVKRILLPTNIVTEFDQALTEAFTWANEKNIDVPVIVENSGWPIALTNAWNKQNPTRPKRSQGN